MALVVITNGGRYISQQDSFHSSVAIVDRNALHSFSFVYCSCARVLIVVKICALSLCHCVTLHNVAYI